jgi:hypothetical protein
MIKKISSNYFISRELQNDISKERHEQMSKEIMMKAGLFIYENFKDYLIIDDFQANNFKKEYEKRISFYIIRGKLISDIMVYLKTMEQKDKRRNEIIKQIEDL